MSEPVPGLLVVDKPSGLTSHDVVSRTRRLAATRKVGHAGTLDPMATGVLVLGIGRATRLLGHLALTDKAYTATVRLGESTTTDDAEGDVVAHHDASGVDDAAIDSAVASLTGELLQVPSSVSAIKVDGVRAHARVRAGEQVELEARRVLVSRFDVLDRRHGPRADPTGAGGVLDLDVTVECSTGTYVRALARDLGAALGVGGHLTALRRTRVGPFDLAHARTLDELADRPAGDVGALPLALAARTAFAALDLDADRATRVRHGRPLDLELADTTAVFDPDGAFLALYRGRGDGTSRALAVFV